MDQELDFENLDDQLEAELDEDTQEDAEIEIDPEEDSEESPKQGNLAKALQAERKEKRDLKERLAKQEADLQRANAFMERMGRPQQPQPDIEQQRAQLQTWMLERPDEFMNAIEQRAQKSAIDRFGPVMAMQAERIIQATPEYQEIYQVPEIRQIVDNFVADQITQGGITNLQDMQEVLNNVMSAVQVIRGTGAVAQPKNPVRDKMTSIAQKGGPSNRKSGDQRMKDLETLARSNPKKYVEEMKKPEVRKFVNETVFGRKSAPT